MAEAAYLFYIIAGEPSGDMLGASLMTGLKSILGTNVRFAGIGGEAMRAQGLESLFPMTDLTVMGLAEVLPRIPRVMRRLDQTLRDIAQVSPVAVVTIDSWGFCGRVHKRLKANLPAIKRLHYVAPMVWAWKKGRTKTLAKVLDMLMTLLPFEPPLFKKEGLKTVYVGHPVIESGAGTGDGAAFRLRHNIAPDVPVLAVLPGSRLTETKRMLPIFCHAVALLAPKVPNLTVVIPTVEGVEQDVRRQVKDWPVPVVVTLGKAQKYDAFAASHVALAASGTVTLELAMARVPMVVGYRVAPLTSFIAQNFLGLRVAYASLLNILMDKLVIPEYLQEKCRAEDLAEAVLPLFEDGPVREAQRAGLARGVEILGGEGLRPSIRAAQAVVDLIKRDLIPLNHA